MQARTGAFAWLAACFIALPAHAITFERLVDCCRVEPSAEYWIGEPALTSDGTWLATMSDTYYPPYYESWPSLRVEHLDWSLPFGISPPSHRGWVGHGAWSPDNRSLAFVAAGIGAMGSIWVYDVYRFGAPEGYRLVTEAWPSSLSWSPDGTNLVFSTGELFRVSATGGAPVPLGVNGYSPSCGPDGAVVYERQRDLWIVGGDGHERRLTDTPTQEVQPSWSPNGGWIAFASNRSGAWDIWIMSPSGGTAVQVTDGPTSEGSPSWAGDGRLVFMSSTAPGDYDVWLATDLPDWTTPVESVSWGTLKSLYR